VRFGVGENTGGGLADQCEKSEQSEIVEATSLSRNVRSQEWDCIAGRMMGT
jgi:hypothetical protein